MITIPARVYYAVSIKKVPPLPQKGNGGTCKVRVVDYIFTIFCTVPAVRSIYTPAGSALMSMLLLPSVML